MYLAKGDAITEEPKWSLNIESPVWNLGYLEIPDQENYKVVFEGSIPEGAVVDVGLDDLNMGEGQCSAPEEDNQCNFDVDFCHYANEQKEDQLDWVLNTRWDPPLTGVADHNGFIYLTHENMALTEENARIVSPLFNFDATGAMCVDFFYLFTEPNKMQLKVSIGQTIGGEYKLEAVTGEGGITGGGANTWRRYRKNVKVSEKDFQMVFDGIIKSNTSILALDRVFINKGNCPSIMACDFDNLDLCSFTNLGSNSFDWMVGSGGDNAGEWTKPDIDHTLGTEDGGFVYVNPGKFEPGQMAVLQAPGYGGQCAMCKAMCLKFWIHFSGKQVGGLDVLLQHNDYTEVIWHVDSDKLEAEWVSSEISYRALDSHHLAFAATTMTKDAIGDIAIDDVSFTLVTDPATCPTLPDYAGANSNYTNPTTAPPSTTSTTTIATTTTITTSTTTYPGETTVTTKTTTTTTTTTTTLSTTVTTTTTATTPIPEPEFDCSFESSLCNWMPAETNEGHDWQLSPDGYAFTKMADLADQHTSSLVSTSHSASKGSCMMFRYNINSGGDNPGHLSVLLQNTDNSSQLTPMWTTNYATSKFTAANVNLKLNQNFAIVFQAKRENEAGGKVSIDDIQMTEKECDGSDGSDSHSCNFDETSLCGYVNDPEGNTIPWMQGAGGLNQGHGPDIDHSTGTVNGYYMYIDGQANGTAMINSPQLVYGGEMCAEVWVNGKKDENEGEFNIYQKRPGQDPVLKWTRRGGEDSKWEITRFPLDAMLDYQLQFQAVVTSPGANHLAFDDVTLLNTDCSIPEACSFANEFCSWTNSLVDTADWLLQPNYIYLDGKNAVVGKKADIISMILDETSGRCAHFMYMVKGKDPSDCISFYTFSYGRARKDGWRLCNDQGDWKEGQFPIVSNTPYFITIEGTTGEGSPVAEMDVRIKQLTFTENACDIQPPEANPVVSTTTVTTTSTTTTWVPSTTTVDYNKFGDCDFEHELCNWEVFTQPVKYGCFDDHSRLLPKRIYSNDSNSPNQCMATCKSEGFIFSGVQYGKECFCGNEEPPVCLARPEEECNMKCPGNQDEMCGGKRRMNIYKQGFDWQLKVASESNHIPHKDHTSNSGGGHYLDLLPLPSVHDRTQTYVGCFVDNSDRLLDERMYRDNNNTIERCNAVCRDKGFLLSGVQDG